MFHLRACRRGPAAWRTMAREPRLHLSARRRRAPSKRSKTSSSRWRRPKVTKLQIVLSEPRGKFGHQRRNGGHRD